VAFRPSRATRQARGKKAGTDVMSSSQAKVFISHIAEESGLATVVKDGIEDAFGGRVDAFASSDRRDNPGGDKWLDRLERELRDPKTKMLVALISPASFTQPWISIELGAAWILHHAVFPLCHSGQKIEQLPRPMQDFGGADLASDDSADRLIGALEKATGLRVPSRWPKKQFLSEMRTAVAASVRTASSAGVSAMAAVAIADLPQEAVQILKALAHAKNHGEEGVDEGEMPALCKLSAARVLHYGEQLVQLGFVRKDYSSVGTFYNITADGVGWLINAGEMPE
jgi:hypothetical protein